VSPGMLQILLVLVLVLVLFGGRGKIQSVMGDMAKGISSFRKGLKDDDEPKSAIPDRGETVDVSPEKSSDASRTES
jgi:sec-independent protein translocase protein TatA